MKRVALPQHQISGPSSPLPRRSVSRVLAAVVLIASAAAAAPAVAAVEQRPLRFAQGASAATVEGRIEGDRVVDHTVAARAGQTMTVEMRTDHDAAYFNVLPPGSRDAAVHVGSVAGNAWSGRLERDGSYTVRVYLMRSAARRHEVAHYTLKVGVEGAASVRSAVPDARVPGTPFHATGKIPCSLGTDAPQQCPFGVVRGQPGHAEVRITTPTGLRRTLRFAGGQVSAGPGEGEVRARRQGDEWEVEVNDFERFRIPEAVVSGG